MKKLLHIIATPHGDESRTLQITEVFLESFLQSHNDWVIETLDLSKEELPSLTTKRVDGKYVLLEGRELHGVMKELWNNIIAHIENFLSADGYLISTPMWNFNIPYMLKHYIDIIVQPKFLFRYTDNGTEGLVTNRKMVIITSRGNDYLTDEYKNFDCQQSYLRNIFGYVGITDIQFIIAQPTDGDKDIQIQKIKEAQIIAQQIAEHF